MPRCTDCGGKRWVSCVKTIYDPDKRKQIQCPECRGTGKAKCWTCNGTGRTK